MAKRLSRFFKRTLRSQLGFSATELMIAAGIGVFVTVGVGMIITQQQDVENTTLLQTNLDTTHSLTIQQIRNIKGLKVAFNLADDGNNPCFGKLQTAGGCSALIIPSSGPLKPMGPGDVIHANVCADPGTCYILSNVDYQTDCSANRCEKITLTVTTSPSPTAIARGRVAKVRTTTITIPGFMFANKSGINFACGASTATVPQNIDYKTLNMSCGSASIATPVPCADNMPLVNFTDTTVQCMPAAVSSCATGYNATGIFDGQETCS